MKRLLVLLFACACPQKQASPPPPPADKPVAAPTCDGERGKVEQLYRAEAQQKEPKRVDEATADNTAMVMTDCAKNPAAIATCLDKAATVSDVEHCLPPLDPEGTEGERR